MKQVDFIVLHHVYSVLYAFRVPDGGNPGYTPRVHDAENYHNLIFHLHSLCRNSELLNSSDELPRLLAYEILDDDPKRSPSKIALECRDGSLSAVSACADAGKFLNVVFADVMRRTLASEQNVVSRQLGNFERKLAMLSLFVDCRDWSTAREIRAIPHLTEHNKKVALKEIAACANYCGKLAISHAVAGELVKFQNEARRAWDHPETMIEGVLRTEGRQARGLLVAPVNDFGEFLVVTATTYIREGRLEVAERWLAREFAPLQEYWGSDPQRLPSRREMRSELRADLNGVLVAQRRVAAKFAQVCACLGRVDAAIGAFHIAEIIEAQRDQDLSPHRGETGRSFVRLHYAFMGHQNNVRARILRVLEENLRHCESLRRYYEVIEWEIERARVSMRFSDLDQCADALANIERFSNEHDLSVSYVALREIEILKYRLCNTTGNGREVRIQDLQSLSASLRANNHRILLIEALNVIASGPYDGRSRQSAVHEIKELVAETMVAPQWVMVG